TDCQTQKVWVVGDFNDDVDTSITTGNASPYANFVTDTARYRFPTKALSDAGIASTTSFPDTIDHHLNSNEANATYVAGSVEVFRVDSFIPNYGSTTSDHFPVLSRYTFGSGGGTTPRVTVVSPNGGESLPGGSVQNITWTSSNVANVRIEYTLDNGANWTVIVSDLASTGSFAWTLPTTSTSAARVRVSDMATTATDQSDGTFTITAGGSPAQVIINEIRANEPGSNTAGGVGQPANIRGEAANTRGRTTPLLRAARHP